ncbi:MAG: DUF370 domain-containing protein [Clostridia bacterium]|nr:DUF370 domain-containing protein [Clostridia bacterium]
MTEIGFGNYVASSRVVAVAGPESAPIKRLVQDAKDAGIAVDVTCGKKTQSVLLTDSGHIILSVLPPEEIQTRLSAKKEQK